MLGEKVLHLADNLSRTLQNKKLSAAEGQHAASLTCDTLSSLRTNEEFVMFWDSVNTTAVDVDEPALPRKRRAPVRLEEEPTLPPSNGGRSLSSHLLSSN